jgi:hypothetical protein
MPSAESYYRRLARLLLADFEYRRGYKFANTVSAFSGWGARIMGLTGMGAMVLNWFVESEEVFMIAT